MLICHNYPEHKFWTKHNAIGLIGNLMTQLNLIKGIEIEIVPQCLHLCV